MTALAYVLRMMPRSDRWSPLPVRAMDLAARSSAGQVDKSGQPYITHLARVAMRVSGDSDAETVAWLHDLIEDASSKYIEELNDTFPPRIVEACRLLARNLAPSQTQYYRLIRANPLALKVKLADIDDNADEARLALLPEPLAARLRSKYQAAREALGGEP